MQKSTRVVSIREKNTLNIVYNIAYYLKLHKAITMYNISHFSLTNIKLVV